MGKKKTTIPKLKLRRTTDAPSSPDVERFVTGDEEPGKVVAILGRQVGTAELPQELASPSVSPAFGNVKQRNDGTAYKSVHLHLDFDLYKTLLKVRADHGGSMKTHINRAIREYVSRLS